MRPSERECRVFLVVEAGRLPVGGGVATTTIRIGLKGGLKLAIVDIGMTGPTGASRSLESDQALSPGDLRFVTTRADSSPVLASQRVSRRTVVKRTGLFPVPNRVAGLTFGLQRSKGTMWGLVTFEAANAFEAESGPLCSRRRSVALRTGDSRVGASQRHSGLGVLHKSESCRLPARNLVAVLAAVLVAWHRELAVVTILMAVAA